MRNKDDYTPLTPEIIDNLKLWKEKTGWGFTAILKRQKEKHGAEVPDSAAVQNWLLAKSNNVLERDYKTVLAAYEDLPEDLWGAPKAVKDNNDRIAVDEELRGIIQVLHKDMRALRERLEQKNVPRGLHVKILYDIKRGITKSIKKDYAVWIRENLTELAGDHMTQGRKKRVS